jgi:hypothetical protein
MSENFPFDTPDDFLNEFENGRQRMSDDQRNLSAEPDVTIHAPLMPDTTPASSQARLLGVGLLAIGGVTQDRWVLLAAVIMAGLVELMRLYHDSNLRAYRNARIAEENVAAIESAAAVKTAFIEN